MDVLRVAVVGVVRVGTGPQAVSGSALGGRRALVALVALALAGRPVPADELAAAMWGDDLPTTWDVALRGVIRGLRTACAPAGGGDQKLIVTAPSGYRLADGVLVDVDEARAATRTADQLLAQGRHQSVLALAEPASRLAGAQLLPAEQAEWLIPNRRAIDAIALHARQLVIEAAGQLGDHRRAIEAAHEAVQVSPLDEGAHRALIAALTVAGDRAGAVQAYEQCRASLADQLGIDPSQETVQVYLSALRDQVAASTARVPTTTSTFLGREYELAEVVDSVVAPGLVTIVGRGGVGKSRLAVRAATGPLVQGSFAGGRLWVALAPVAEDALVASAVAMDLGVSLGNDDAELAVADYLAPLGRVLLILDGCELIVDGVASLIALLLARAPMLTVLATSRRPLGIDGERTVAVEPLPVPVLGAASDVERNIQVRLLADRVRESGAVLTIDERVAPLVVALCQRCGGLPLAVELVAAQLAAMPAGDLVDHLSEVAIDGEDRLRAVARSSYQLLDDDEAAVFRQFGVLDGPVGLPFVRQVVARTSIPPVRVVRILRELTARGMLAVDRSGPRWRYQQDDDLHRLARELLVELGDESAAYDRVADAIRALLPDDARASPAPYQEALTDVLGSLRSLFGAGLIERADRQRCLELAFRLHRYFAATSVAEGRFWLSRLLAGAEGNEWTPYATFALGYLNYWSGNVDDAVLELQNVVRLLDGAPTPYLARAQIYLAGMLDDLDRGAEAVEYIGRAIVAARPFDIDLQVAAAMGMGSILAERVDPEAPRYAHDAIELGRRAAADQLALALPTAAMVCWQAGAIDDARAYVVEARERLGDSRRIARVVMLSAAAGVALADGDLDAAVDYGRTADAEASGLGVEREVPLIRSILARALLERGDITAAANRAAAAVNAALALSYPFPLALCLETAALIAGGSGGAGSAAPAALGALLASADAIRARGERPPSLPMQAALEGLRSRSGPIDIAAGVAVLDAGAAAALALTLLAPLLGPAG